ncbi:MAG: DUF1552 domain-containing protein [Candidatus Solibacter usitatus]|nr:DUF1552 domain-containing protein [Candidatus Solibacter usitatus]
MIITRKALPRRTFLRGIGAAIGLPFLDAMTPALSAATKSPLRAAWFYVPNGVDMRHWTPENDGPLGKLPRMLEPFEPVKKDILLLSNLTANWGRPLLVGAGDHGRAAAAYMTGVEVYRTAGADLKLTTSADQIAAKAIGGNTKLPSLEVGLEEARQSGNCDNGYSCAYTYNLSWKTESQPLPPISDPRGLFERLFGSDIAESPADHLRRLAMRRSILDQVGDDTRRLQSNVGAVDRRKLDEYLTSVREIEQQVQRAEKEGLTIDPGIEKPFGVPPEFNDYFGLMTDMMLIAFKADLTRIATFMMGREGSTRSYREIGISDGHHPLTHHMGNREMLEKVANINCYHARLFAAFLQKLKETKEGDSNLLDQSIIVYGSGLSDGNVHTHDQLPTLLAGRAGKRIDTGRHITYQRETPVANLFATMLEYLDVHPKHVGDSTGRLAGLSLS